MQEKLSDLDATGVPKHIQSEKNQINEIFLYKVKI